MPYVLWFYCHMYYGGVPLHAHLHRFEALSYFRTTELQEPERTEIQRVAEEIGAESDQ